MMAQAVWRHDLVKPNEILFVLDAMVSQDAVNASSCFPRQGWALPAWCFLSSTATRAVVKALSVRGVTGAPVLFASTGEGPGRL